MSGKLVLGLLMLAAGMWTVLQAGFSMPPPRPLPIETNATPVAYPAPSPPPPLTPAPSFFALGTPPVSRLFLECWEGPMLTPEGCPTPARYGPGSPN